MPLWLKVVLGVVAGFIALLALLIGVGAMWLKNHKGELIEEGKRAMEEGRSFGAGKEKPACIAEGMRRLPATDGIGQEVRNNLFTRGCIDAATDPGGFCTDVPPTSEIMATVKWRAGTCAGHSELDPQKCQRFLQTWQEACHARK